MNNDINDLYIIIDQVEEEFKQEFREVFSRSIKRFCSLCKEKDIELTEKNGESYIASSAYTLGTQFLVRRLEMNSLWACLGGFMSHDK